MDLTIEELHKFDDMSAKQRQLALADSTKSKTSQKDTPLDAEKHLFGEDGFTFDDFLDIINPLQHIPVISTIYRELTGDQIAHMPRILGGTLFGGPIGAGAAIVNAALHQETGKDIGGHVVALFNEEPSTALAAKPAEADLVTAAGSDKTNSTDSLAASMQAQTNNPAAPLAIVKPTLAELEILQAESRGKQAAQISQASQASYVEFPKNQNTEPTPTVTTSLDQDKAVSAVKPAAPEEQILALEKAVERLTQKRGASQRANLNPGSIAANTPVTIHTPPQLPAQLPAQTNGAIKSYASTASGTSSAKGVTDVTAGANSPWLSFQPANPKAPAPAKTTANTKVSSNTSAIPRFNTAANKAATMAATAAAIAPGKPPLGAVANKGGWFSDVMVSALTKYEQSKQLKQAAPSPAINQLN